MKVLIVGDRPSKRMAPGAKPFQGAACEKRLREWIKFLELKDIEIINQSEFPNSTLDWYLYGKYYKIIALGNNASKVLWCWKHFQLPHPSGRNRQLNRPEFIERKLKECKNWLNETTST